MGLFDFFKKGSEPQPVRPILKLQGPKYLRNHLSVPAAGMGSTVKIQYPDIQWLGQLVSQLQNRFFQIRYYGKLLDNETITDTEEGVLRVVAINPDSKEEILLFDKMLHGFDGFISNANADSASIARNADKRYHQDTSEKFQILILAFYNEGTRQELMDQVDPNGNIETENGHTIPIQDAFDDAFDVLAIYAIDEKGRKFDLVNEELA